MSAFLKLSELLPNKHDQLAVNDLRETIANMSECRSIEFNKVFRANLISLISKYMNYDQINPFDSGSFWFSDQRRPSPLSPKQNDVIQKIKAHLPVAHYPYSIPYVVSHEPVTHTYQTIAVALQNATNEDLHEFLIRQIMAFLRKLLVSIIRRMFIRSFIDLRQIFRNIIRFLFKNMDDCDSNNKELTTAPYPRQSLLNLNSIIYGHSNSSQYTAGAH